MINRKMMFISILFIVAVCAVSHVSAEDMNGTQQLTVEDNVEVTQTDDVSAIDNDDTLKMESSEDIVKGSDVNAKITPINLEGGYKTGNATVKLTDLNNNPLPNQKVKITVSGKVSWTTDRKTDTNGIATFNFSDLRYAESVVKDSKWNITYYDLTVGKWAVKFDLKDSSYGVNTVTDTLTVKKAYANINLKSLNVDFGSNEFFTMSLTDSATGMPIANEYLRVKLLNVADEYFMYLTDSEGKVQINVNQFSPGTYLFSVSAANEDNIQASQKSANVIIKEIPKKLSIVSSSKKFKNSGQLILKVKDKTTGKYVSGVKLKIKIFTGKKYKTFNLVTKKSKKISNAIGVLLKTNKFSVGSHKVTVKITTAKYKGSATLKLVIPKTAKKYKKFTYVVSNGKAKYV